MWWLIIPVIIMIGLLIGMESYLISRFHKFHIIEKLSKGNKKRSWALAAVPVGISGILMLWDVVSVIVVLIHLFVFWVISDGIQWMVTKLSKIKPVKYYAGIAAILVTTCYLGLGWYHAHHVIETAYEVTTEKELPDDKLRILQLTDMHLGATFDGDGFAKHLEKIKQCNPDVIVITGDFVDEDSTKEDMIISCKALGEMESAYGTYFIYGNHDKGIYKSTRDFSKEELEQELEKNGIIILEDDVVQLDEKLTLVGRQDKSEPDRKTMSELTEGVDKSEYMIVLDHQPADYDAQKETEVDLVLSGHTHGGHIYPIGPIGEALEINCMTYGMRKEGNTTFEVSSGISGWAIPFKTGGAVSEYVVIDVIQE